MLALNCLAWTDWTDIWTVYARDPIKARGMRVDFKSAGIPRILA